MLTTTLFVALLIPLLIALLLTRDGARRFIFFFLYGFVACLMGSYINGFIVAVSAQTMSAAEVAVKITPITEEALKALPILLSFATFAPRRKWLTSCAVFVGLGFAMMESAYIIAASPEADLPFALVRGLSAGAMHTICGAVLGFGLSRIGPRKLQTFPAAFAVVCVVSTIHATYNLFVTAGGAWSFAGIMIPTVAGAALLFAIRWLNEQREAQPEDDA